MKNILITGGAGFIGSNLANELAKKGYKVRVLDSLSPQIHGKDPDSTSPLFASLDKNIDFVNGDVTNRNVLEKSIQDQDVIVHLAAETGTGQSMYEIAKYSKVNVGGTALLLDIIANEPNIVKKVIIASSRAIYGEGKYYSKKSGFVYPAHRSEVELKNGNFEVAYPGIHEVLKLVGTDEDSKIHPSSVYGITKQTQEQLVMTVTKSLGISGVALRYQNVYGPGQSLSNPYTGILSIFSTRIMQGKSINIFEDGLESRDFVFIDDVVSATIMGIENEEADNEVFNVGSGISTNVNYVVEKLMQNFNKQVPVTISGNYRIGDIRHNYADLNKIKEKLNFEPKVSFDLGISKFVAWVKAQSSDALVDLYEESLEEMKIKGLFK